MNASTACSDLPALKPADFKSKVKPIWCPGCGD